MKLGNQVTQLLNRLEFLIKVTGGMIDVINRKYYSGFEGEPELVLVNGENKLIIWIGYFEAILDALLETNVEKKGILK